MVEGREIGWTKYHADSPREKHRKGRGEAEKEARQTNQNKKGREEGTEQPGPQREGAEQTEQAPEKNTGGGNNNKKEEEGEGEGRDRRVRP